MRFNFASLQKARVPDVPHVPKTAVIEFADDSELEMALCPAVSSMSRRAAPAIPDPALADSGVVVGHTGHAGHSGHFEVANHGEPIANPIATGFVPTLGHAGHAGQVKAASAEIVLTTGACALSHGQLQAVAAPAADDHIRELDPDALGDWLRAERVGLVLRDDSLIFTDGLENGSDIDPATVPLVLRRHVEAHKQAIIEALTL